MPKLIMKSRPVRHRFGPIALLAGLALVIAIVTLAACSRQEPAHNDLTRLTRARAVIETQGSANTFDTRDATDATDVNSQRDITLPFNWDKTVGGADGLAVLTLAFARTGPPSEPMAIATRIGNAFP
jgi:hypothetical protein